MILLLRVKTLMNSFIPLNREREMKVVPLREHRMGNGESLIKVRVVNSIGYAVTEEEAI